MGLLRGRQLQTELTCPQPGTTRQPAVEGKETPRAYTEALLMFNFPTVADSEITSRVYELFAPSLAQWLDEHHLPEAALFALDTGDGGIDEWRQSALGAFRAGVNEGLEVAAHEGTGRLRGSGRKGRERAFVSEILWCMTRLNSSDYAGIDAAHRFGLDVGYWTGRGEDPALPLGRLRESRA
ncbi:MAG: hypothetical protein ABI658_04965 [Acidimicrobiales bacterium]